jgi:hypothetical protein
MQTKQKPVPLFLIAASLAAFALTGACKAADSAAATVPPDASFWTKPAWLSDLSFAVKESYDDNVFGVSGLGLPVQSSWVNAVSANVGVNLVPLLGDQKNFSTLSLSYNPERFTFASVSSQDYTAHRVNGALKAKAGNVTFSLVNSFLYNDGNKLAPTYALNQLSGAAGNQNDKYRNNFAHALARERLNQEQDRYTASVQFDEGSLFVRPISQLTYYDLNTYLFNTSVAPYKGYQDYVGRYDFNAGVDLGYYIVPGLAFTVGYRDGHQEQEQFALAINSDQHFSTSNYQRALFGLEGKLAPWLTLKAAAGPDFRDYNPDTPISNLHTTRYYGEGTATATLPDNQSLTIGYKQWLFVSSTGLVPYVDSSISAAYHWSATKQLGIDLGVKYLESNYRLGNDTAGSAPSERDDIEEDASAGISYAVTKQFVLSVADTYDKAYNGFGALPATLFPAYRDFTHNVVTFGAQYKF